MSLVPGVELAVGNWELDSSWTGLPAEEWGVRMSCVTLCMARDMAFYGQAIA